MTDWSKVTSCVATEGGPVLGYAEGGAVGAVGQGPYSGSSDVYLRRRPYRTVDEAMVSAKSTLLLWGKVYHVVPYVQDANWVLCWNSAGWQTCHQQLAQQFANWWNQSGHSPPLAPTGAFVESLVNALNWWATHFKPGLGPAVAYTGPKGVYGTPDAEGTVGQYYRPGTVTPVAAVKRPFFFKVLRVVNRRFKTQVAQDFAQLMDYEALSRRQQLLNQYGGPSCIRTIPPEYPPTLVCAISGTNTEYGIEVYLWDGTGWSLVIWVGNHWEKQTFLPGMQF